MKAIDIDLILVRCRLAQAEGLRAAAERFCAQSDLDLRLQRAAWSPSTGWTYVYLQPPAAVPVEAAAVPRLPRLWETLLPQAQGSDVSRLQLVQDIPGASPGELPTRHYVVETDPEPEWEAEIVRWYVEEHLPGLAAVPGCVEARRFVNHDAGPRSHACYGLATEDTFGCPPWLAVRGTAWSSRVRPHFTNTRRTMMHVVA